jgi:hypothetical protein
MLGMALMQGERDVLLVLLSMLNNKKNECEEDVQGENKDDKDVKFRKTISWNQQVEYLSSTIRTIIWAS